MVVVLSYASTVCVHKGGAAGVQEQPEMNPN